MAIGDTGSRMVGNTEFYGGLATDSKIGIENSYADGECLDVRKSPSQMTVLPMARTVPDGGVITGLMTAMVQSKDGNIWGVDENGDLYKIDENNAITKISDTAASSGFGLQYFHLDDALWFTDGGHKLFSYADVLNPSGRTPETNEFEFLEDHSARIVNAIYIQRNNDQVFYQTDTGRVREAGASTCAVPTSISETEANKILFLPAVMPVAKVGVKFMAKPNSGTVRVVIHDENDNEVASSLPISAANIPIGGYANFDVRPNPNMPVSPTNQLTKLPWAGPTQLSGTVLHIHVVASTGGFTVKTWDANNMWLGADITCTGYMLYETFNKKHPMVMYDNLYIGNGRFVSVKKLSPPDQVPDTLFTQSAIMLDDGFEVCSFGSSDEYLIIGAEKYSAGSSRGFQEGRIYFWDMVTEEPNFFIDCNMGSPKCIFNFGNIVYIIIAGALYAYTGGKELVKVRTLRGTDTEFTGHSSVTEVNPNMMAVRREILLMGFPSDTTAYSIRHGIYAFGSVDKNYPKSFTYNYKVPGENPGITLPQYNSDDQHLRIGCVYNFNDTLFYSYEAVNPKTSDKRVALAVVDNSSGTSTTFMWKSLQYDAGSPIFEKQALRVGIYFDPLPENTTITPMFRIDHGEWQMGPATASQGDRKITCEINERFHELQYGFIGETGNDTLTPVIKQVSAEVRILNEEGKIYA